MRPGLRAHRDGRLRMHAQGGGRPPGFGLRLRLPGFGFRHRLPGFGYRGLRSPWFGTRFAAMLRVWGLGSRARQGG